jgi:hypothetical protein
MTPYTGFRSPRKRLPVTTRAATVRRLAPARHPASSARKPARFRKKTATPMPSDHDMAVPPTNGIRAWGGRIVTFTVQVKMRRKTPFGVSRRVATRRETEWATLAPALPVAPARLLLPLGKRLAEVRPLARTKPGEGPHRRPCGNTSPKRKRGSLRKKADGPTRRAVTKNSCTSPPQ